MPNFATIKSSIPIETAAQYLNLVVHKEKNQLRGCCPACENEDERILAITPSMGCFFCHHAKIGGSVIDLAAHILGLPLRDAAQWLEDTLPLAGATTVPTKPEPAPPRSHGSASKAAVPAQMREPFDPEGFGSKLTYSDQVAALGLSEQMAREYRIGIHRGKLYIPLCPPDVVPVAYAEYHDGNLKLPDKWLPPKVVPFKRPA